MRGFNLSEAYERLNCLNNEEVREVLYAFMPLKAVKKAVPLTKYRIGKLSPCTSHKPRNMNLVDKYLRKIAFPTFLKLVKRVEDSSTNKGHRVQSWKSRQL